MERIVVTLASLVVCASTAPVNTGSAFPFPCDEAAALAAHPSQDSLVQYSSATLCTDASGALAGSIERGWFTFAAALVVECRVRGVKKTSSTIFSVTSNMQRGLKELKELVRRPILKKGQEVVHIAPAFEWAQSPDHVFISLKMAHKMDTPATLDCVWPNATVEIGHDVDSSGESDAARRFAFVVKCPRTHKVFALNMTLLKPLVGAGSTWSEASVGRITFTLKKRGISVWSRLLKDKSTKPDQMHTWWRLKEENDAVNEKFIEDEEATKKEKRKQARLEKQRTEDEQRAKDRRFAGYAKARLASFYAVHNASKVSEVDEIVARRSPDEYAEMLAASGRKYAVDDAEMEASNWTVAFKGTQEYIDSLPAPAPAAVAEPAAPPPAGAPGADAPEGDVAAQADAGAGDAGAPSGEASGVVDGSASAASGSDATANTTATKKKKRKKKRKRKKKKKAKEEL